MTKFENLGKQFEEIAKNDEAIKAFSKTKTLEERVQVLKTYGIEMTVEELDELEEMLVKGYSDGEISETELEKVSGGVVVTTLALGAAACFYTGCFGVVQLLWRSCE